MSSESDLASTFGIRCIGLLAKNYSAELSREAYSALCAQLLNRVQTIIMDSSDQQEAVQIYVGAVFEVYFSILSID